MQQRSAAARGEGGRRASTWAREEQVAAELSRGLPRELSVQGPNLLTTDSVFLFYSNSQPGSGLRQAGERGQAGGGSERRAEVLRGVCGGSAGSGGGAGEAGRGGDGTGRTLANCLEVPGDAGLVWLAD